MKAILIAVVILVGGTLNGNAAPWRNMESVVEGIDVTYALQNDSSGEYILGIHCLSRTGVPHVTIVTPHAADATASYPAVFPVTFAMDGASLAFDFELGEAGGRASMTVASHTELDDLNALLPALRRARGPIEASYLDTRLSFSSEGSSSAIGVVQTACSVR